MGHDIELTIDPFNIVDDLLFSLLAYTDFSEIMTESDCLTLSEASNRYFQLHSVEEILKQTSFTKYAPLLLKEMGASKRFASTRIFGYVDEIDSNKVKQLSIISCQMILFM